MVEIWGKVYLGEPYLFNRKTKNLWMDECVVQKNILIF